MNASSSNDAAERTAGSHSLAAAAHPGVRPHYGAIVTLLDAVFAVSPAVRYVALYQEGQLTSRQRSDLVAASASESDKYEELIVNPTLITLVRQRGEIDCGGLEYVLIRYGNFFEFVQPLRNGHLSVGIEMTADVAALAAEIRALAPIARLLK